MKAFEALSPRQRKIAATMPDLVCLGVLLLLGLSLWPQGGGPDLPSWATLHDQLISGPDSGAWAAGALAHHGGRFEDLDPHRMPTWILLASASLHWFPVALAGHFTNHMLQLLLPLVVYVLGRGLGGKAVGLGAGLWVATCPVLVATSRRFGVDPAITFFVPAMAMAVVWTARHWKYAFLAGLVGGMCASTHFTTLAYPLAGLVGILLLGEKGRQRWAAGLAFALGCVAWLYWVFGTFPWPGISGLWMAVPEGIVPGHRNLQGSPGAAWTQALAVVQQGMGSAVNDTVTLMVRSLRPPSLPWAASVAVVWWGVPGFFLKSSGDSTGWRKWLAGAQWKEGLFLLVCAAPLPLLAAAGAEPRYSQNLLPVVALLGIRGAVSLARGVELLVTRFRPGLPAGSLGLVLVLLGARSYQADSGISDRQQPPPMAGMAAMKLGNALNEHFPGAGGVVSDFREAIVYTDRQYCPGTVCPHASHEGAFSGCVAILREECEGEGPIPFVSLTRSEHDERSEARKAMEVWAIEQWGVAAEVNIPGFRAQIVAIPRTDTP